MNEPTLRRAVLVAGEASGDALGAALIQSMRDRASGTGIEFGGIGGPLMRAAGMDCWYDAEELAVMGLTEVLRHLPRLLRIRRSMANKSALERMLGWIGGCPKLP